MTVKLIVDSEMVRTRMGVPDHEDVNRTLDSILPAAHLVFQSILDSSFEVISSTSDQFYLDPNRQPVLNSHFRLRLKRAFVKTGVVVSYSTERSGTQEVMDTSDYYVDYEKGIVHVYEGHANRYVTVTYSAGFDASNKAPDWLVESILTYIPSIINDQQPTNRSDEAGRQYHQNLKLASVLLESHMRGTAFHIRPLM